MAFPHAAHADQDRRFAGAARRSVPWPRRNHAKGICFTGVFEFYGNGAELSSAQVFARGEYPALGRFNLATADANAPDFTVRVRGLGLQLSTPNGEVWRSAMIDPPIFTVSTPEGFYELQLATHSKDPNAMKAFVAGHPEFDPFAEWAKTTPWVASYAEETYNSLNSFIFVSGSGAEHAVRWSLVPQAQVVQITQEDLAKLGPNYLAQEITERVAKAPQRWTMVVTVADPGDPTADPSIAWPPGRRAVEVGTLVVQRIEGDGMARAATSISTRRSCPTASMCRTIHSRRRDPPPMRCPMTCVRRN